MKRLDDQVLSALGHVQAHTDAGDGSETIIHSLANQDFGRLSERTKKLLLEMQQGASFEETMKREFDVSRNKPRERGYSLLIAALASETGDIESRLENIADEVMTRNREAAEGHAKKVKFLAYGALLLIMLTVFVPLGPVLMEAGSALSGGSDPAAAQAAADEWDPSSAYISVFMIVSVMMVLMIRWR